MNLVDTPGYPDFLGRALPVLAAVETTAVVVDARQGVQMVTRRMMEAAAQRGLARMVVVNKIDADELESGGVAREPGGCVRHRVHAHQSARGRRPERRGLLLRTWRRAGRLLVGGRSAHPDRRPGRRGRRGADGALPGAGRGAGGGPAPRRVRESVARRPSHSGVLHVGGDRGGNCGARRRDREGHAESAGGQSPAVSRRRGGAGRGRARPRWCCHLPISSRSRSTPSWASSGCSESIGAR